MRNPQTGARIKAKKTAVPKFTAGADLKNVVSGAKKLPKLTVAAASGSPAKKATAAAKKAPRPAQEGRAGEEGGSREEGAGQEGAGQEGRGQEGAGQEGAGQEGTGQEGGSRPRRRRPRRPPTAKKAPAKKAAPRQEGAPAKKAARPKKAPAKKAPGQEDAGQEGRPPRSRPRSPDHATRVARTDPRGAARLLHVSGRSGQRRRRVRGPTPSAQRLGEVGRGRRRHGAADAAAPAISLRPGVEVRAARAAGRTAGRTRRSGAAYIVVPDPGGVGDEASAPPPVTGPAPRRGRRRQRGQVGAERRPGPASGQRRRASAAASRRVPLRSPVTPSGSDGAARVRPGRARSRASSVTTRTAATRGAARPAEHGVQGERGRQLAPRRRRAARPAATCRRRAA